MLTDKDISLGDKMGDWQLKGVYDKGVTVVNAGMWTPNPAPKHFRDYLKHSGVIGGEL